MARGIRTTERVKPAREGFVVCIHTCNQTNQSCNSRSTGTLLWKCEGNAVQRHADKERLHPNCNTSCSGYEALKGGKNRARPPTEAELSLWLNDALIRMGRIKKPDEEEKSMDVEMADAPPAAGPSDASRNPSPTPSTVVWDPTLPSQGNIRVDRNHRFRVLYILDPTRICQVPSDARSDLGYIDTYIFEDDLHHISKLLGVHVLRNKMHRQKRKVRMPEWLSVMLRFSHLDDANAFQVDYQNWAEFSSSMLDRQANTSWWQDVRKYDLLIGVADFTLDYMSGIYHLDGDNVQMYMESLEALKRIVIVWPPTEQMMWGGNKAVLAENLEAIAGSLTHSHRPCTQTLSQQDFIPSSTVLKRSHSDCGDHVIMPSENRPRDFSILQPLSEIPNCAWISQQFVPLLRELGEWRCFIVDGKIIYTVFTSSTSAKKWEGNLVSFWYTLDELGKIITPSSSPLTWKDIVNPNEGTISVREQGRNEFQNFVLTTHKELVRMEGRRFGAKPSIALFCRLDVGLIKDEDGSLHYFVNEVERAQTASLWGMLSTKDTMVPTNTLADTLAEALHKWLIYMNSSTMVQ